jgi:AraC-like DNA-binding protein
MDGFGCFMDFIGSQTAPQRESFARERFKTKDIPVTIPRKPLSPWLRLATIAVTGGDSGGPGEDYAKLRKLDDFEVILQVEGTSYIWCEAIGGSIDITAGDIAFFPPGFVHGWNYSVGTHIGVHFDLHARPAIPAFATIHIGKRLVYRHPVSTMPMFELNLPDIDPQHAVRVPLITRLQNPEVWRHRLEVLVHMYQTHTEQTLHSMLITSETIGWILSNLACKDQRDGRTFSNIHPAISELLHQLKSPASRRALENLSASELARRAGMSEKAFRKAFFAATNRNPYEYMVERRIEQAAHLLLETDKKVAEVAQTVGYDDQFYFSRMFSRVTGLSPLQYRKASVAGELLRTLQDAAEPRKPAVVPFGPREQEEAGKFLPPDVPNE